ncbi:MAG: ankyrin repeat domain-containing protein [Candidatus Fermentibacteraceae bacterium]|nr:ankyrin repeat domain-containing protein [Candidatus Fermentibacteraceae bacterium]MBN2608929.1 ankyrin repeat domain-containing protein [Candidatus Fermentibacteraceae bacterium]
MERNLKLKADTLSKAEEELHKKIPSGFFLVASEQKESVRLSRRVSADTIDEAFEKARKEIPGNAVNVKENVVRKPTREIKNLRAFDEAEAGRVAVDKSAEAFRIVRVDISEKGSRGFLGFGKKPNLYSVELFQQAIVEVDYSTPAEISAEITDNVDRANNEFLVHSEEGSHQLVKILLKQGVDINACNSNGATALILSAFNGHSQISNLLIDNGIDIHKKDNGGFNSLMVACECATADIELVKRLIDSGADVNATSGRKSTALMAAAKTGHPDIVELLVSEGADINARNADHNITPLIWAANGGHSSIVEFLLEKGADPAIVTNNNYTAASIAKENGYYSIVEILNRYQEGKMGKYWAYLHKYGKVQVKEWYQGNTFISEARTSPNVKRFLEEPFEAASFEKAEDIAAKLLDKEN